MVRRALAVALHRLGLVLYLVGNGRLMAGRKQAA